MYNDILDVTAPPKKPKKTRDRFLDEQNAIFCSTVTPAATALRDAVCRLIAESLIALVLKKRCLVEFRRV